MYHTLTRQEITSLDTKLTEHYGVYTVRFIALRCHFLPKDGHIFHCVGHQEWEVGIVEKEL